LLLKKIKYTISILWQILLLGILLYIMINPALWVYLLRQGKGQFNVLYHTQKVEKVLANKLVSAAQEKKIKLIKEIKIFAEKEFGLAVTNNYTSYFDQHGKPILWMLTACDPFSFKEKVWHFPLLGEVSYKGFFNYDLAIYEANQLKMKHYDVDIGKVSAWSTLGFLPDPILSSMLENDEGALAELIIHELTHATLYFASNVDFNENFASFVGQQGAKLFIEHKYGKHSKQMHQYLTALKMENKLKTFLLEHKVSLEAFYNELDQDLTSQEKLKMKQQKMSQIINELYALEIYNWKTKIRIAHKIRISGNAYFMSFNRYDAQYNKLNALFQQNNNHLKSFINYAKQNLAKDH